MIAPAQQLRNLQHRISAFNATAILKKHCSFSTAMATHKLLKYHLTRADRVNTDRVNRVGGDRPGTSLACAALVGTLLGSMVLVSCAPANPGAVSSEGASSQGSGATADSRSGQPIAPAPITNPAPTANATDAATPRSQPQLVKTATLVLTVESVEASIDAVRQVIQQHQGDLLELQDSTPTNDRSYRTASLQLRVPQAKLESALQALKALGTVQRQGLTAEDVSDQLVDYEARLRNLRKTEATLLEIMEQSGEIGDVLQVAQELSNVRNSIEQVAAQLSNLQNRVAYSTIQLSVEEVIAGNLPQRSTATQLEETWKSATRSLSKSTVDLLQLGIWLLVYSPYWLILAGIGVFLHSRLKSRPTRPASERES